MSYFLAGDKTDPYGPSEINADGDVKVADVWESGVGISHGKNTGRIKVYIYKEC